MTRKRIVKKRLSRADDAEIERLRKQHERGELDVSRLFDEQGLDKLLEKMLSPGTRNPNDA